MRLIKNIILVSLALYIGVCGALYFTQKTMLFPAYLAKPVTSDWQPSAGDTQVNIAKDRMSSIIPITLLMRYPTSDSLFMYRNQWPKRLLP